MSSNQSERATGRVGDLRESVIDRLRSHTELVTLLEQTDDVDDATDVINPSFRLRIQNQSDDLETPGVAIGVGVITGSSERENHHERKRLVVQTTIQLREQTFKRQGDAWLDDVRDEVSAVLTTHASPWIARGESGGTFEPLWDENINRYASVQQFDIQNFG
ncbi:hypothetical protein [Natrinema soli]|uniref:Uncharacterized protein n=1 Tax=Natrinema soli TaxID=1930624 RepID=A0ABD5SS92_9EURY|nr:hypothetical protein [Natrinema soli]